MAIDRDENIVKEFIIRAQNFQVFLPKLELINQLILYKTNFFIFSHAIIYIFAYNVGFFLYNSLYND